MTAPALRSGVAEAAGLASGKPGMAHWAGDATTSGNFPSRKIHGDFAWSEPSFVVDSRSRHKKRGRHLRTAPSFRDAPRKTALELVEGGFVFLEHGEHASHERMPHDIQLRQPHDRDIA